MADKEVFVTIITRGGTSGGVKTALDAKAAKSEIVKTSTGLTDSADLMRYSDTLTINGGGVS